MGIFRRIINWFKMSDNSDSESRTMPRQPLVGNLGAAYINNASNRLSFYGRTGLTINSNYDSWLSPARSWGDYIQTRRNEAAITDRIAQGAKEACERVDAYNALRYVYGQLKHEQLNISNEDIDKIMIILKLVDSLSYRSKADRTAALDWLIRVATFCAQEKEENKGTDDFEI